MPLPGFHYFGTICPEVLKAGGILVVPSGQRYNYHVRNHICKRVVFERFTKIYRIQYLYPVPTPLQELSALHKDGAFRVGNNVGTVHLH